jgi:midasin
VITDGLETLPTISAFGRERLAELRRKCLAKLEDLASNLGGSPSTVVESTIASQVSISASQFAIGPFSISKGAQCTRNAEAFAMEAPTTMDNLLRVVRACQVPKSILLEGSPGVGKTSLVQALADACDRLLCRINLSDQTDLIDLFGSDLPVAGGSAGEFAWQDAAFLTAMQNGDWVLLDEMNLASQAVLEGLNAVLDHRGSVYVPELDRTFVKHPDFRLFAAQNPVQQGGGRKGLPKSFLNRFTKVYVQEHTPQDLVLICQRIFPDLDSGMLRNVIKLNEELYEATMVHRQFGQEGGPWEFNLRDIIRLFRLYLAPNGFEGPDGLAGFLQMVYVNRFRTLPDQHAVCEMIRQLFGITIDPSHRPWLYVARTFVQVGYATLPRSSSLAPPSLRAIRQIHHQQHQSLLKCITAGWLAILVGSAGAGKRSAVRAIAAATGTRLHEYSMHSGVDTMEMLGTFEQSDSNRQLNLAAEYLNDILISLELETRTVNDDVQRIANSLRHCVSADVGERAAVLQDAQEACNVLASLGVTADRLSTIRALLHDASRPTAPSFEWIDGPLVTAIKQGHWFFINDANLCSPSVLDRLNSLCEMNGTLALSEKGGSSGQTEILRPHPHFRLFLAYDPLKGELSRAMRNRGIEVAFLRNSDSTDTDLDTLLSTFLQQSSDEAYAVLQVPDIQGQSSTSIEFDTASMARAVTGGSLDLARVVKRIAATGNAKSAQEWSAFANSLDSGALEAIVKSDHASVLSARRINEDVCNLLVSAATRCVAQKLIK